MLMKKLAEDHYIITDDSEIKEGDWVVSGTKTIVQCMYPENVHHEDIKKITHSTQPLEWFGGEIIFLSEVKELLNMVDVEKSMWYERNLQNPYPSDSPSNTGFNKGFELGYNQALEDNKEKKYTERDLWRAFDSGKAGKMALQFYETLFQPPTEWEVEIVDGKLKLKQ